MKIIPFSKSREHLTNQYDKIKEEFKRERELALHEEVKEAYFNAPTLQEGKGMAAHLVGGIGNIQHFQNCDDHDRGNENGIEQGLLQLFLAQVCQRKTAQSNGNEKVGAGSEEFRHGLHRLSLFCGPSAAGSPCR